MAPPFALYLSCFRSLAVIFLLLSCCFFSLLYLSCSWARSSLMFYFSSSFYFGSSLPLHRSRTLCPALSFSPYPSRSVSSASLSRFFSFPSFLFLVLFSSSLFLLSVSRALNFFSHLQRHLDSAEWSADYCGSVGKAFLKRSCIGCDCHVHYRCDRGNRYALMKTTELAFKESPHLACSRAC